MHVTQEYSMSLETRIRGRMKGKMQMQVRGEVSEKERDG